MTTYIIRRILGLFPVLFGITLIVFFLIRLIPGDAANVIAGEKAKAEEVEAIREQLGLNKPVVEQYFAYMGQLFRGNLGKSIIKHTQIIDELAYRLPATMEMIVGALIIGVTAGVTIGVVSAVKRNSWFDVVGMIAALAGVSMPIFWLALILIWEFSVHFRIFPVSGRIDALIDLDRVTGFLLIDSLLAKNWNAFVNVVWHMLLPSFVLSTVIMPGLARITRACMLDVLNQDYVRTARAKGLSERVVIIKHALKNALLPVLTVIGGTLAGMLGGAILTETVFSWPGMGTWLYGAISGRDYPIVQTGVLVSATIYVFVNLFVDILYAFVDPRVRYT